MIIRIPIDTENSTVVPIKDPSADNSRPTDSFTLPAASFELLPSTLPEYDYSRYANPAIPISVNIPDTDLPIVAAWLGNTTSEAQTPGDTMVKRMTDAVISRIRDFFTTTAKNSLFTRPFRIGYALRLADGTHACATRPVTILPNSRAPIMIVREPRLAGNVLSTVTEIVNTAYCLRMSLPSFDIPDPYSSLATHLDIYATRQCDTLDGDETVSAIRTYSVYGENVPCWHYSRLTEDLVREKTEADNSFRIIGSLPVEDAISGLKDIRLPLNFKNLDDWDIYPSIKPDDGPGSGQSEDDTASHFRLITVPLDLGLPETRKRIRSVTARGMFPRDMENGIEISLYGSHHREKWRLLASARGAHIRLLRAMRYRWLRIEITARAGSAFDALTFEVAKA